MFEVVKLFHVHPQADVAHYEQFVQELVTNYGVTVTQQHVPYHDYGLNFYVATDLPSVVPDDGYLMLLNGRARDPEDMLSIRHDSAWIAVPESLPELVDELIQVADIVVGRPGLSNWPPASICIDATVLFGDQILDAFGYTAEPDPKFAHIAEPHRAAAIDPTLQCSGCPGTLGCGGTRDADVAALAAEPDSTLRKKLHNLSYDD